LFCIGEFRRGAVYIKYKRGGNKGYEEKRVKRVRVGITDHSDKNITKTHLGLDAGREGRYFRK